MIFHQTLTALFTAMGAAALLALAGGVDSHRAGRVPRRVPVRDQRPGFGIGLRRERVADRALGAAGVMNRLLDFDRNGTADSPRRCWLNSATAARSMPCFPTSLRSTASSIDCMTTSTTATRRRWWS